MKFSLPKSTNKKRRAQKSLAVSQDEIIEAVERRKLAGTFCVNCGTRASLAYCSEECQIKSKRKAERLAKARPSIVPVAQFARPAVEPGKTYSVPSN